MNGLRALAECLWGPRGLGVLRIMGLTHVLPIMQLPPGLLGTESCDRGATQRPLSPEQQVYSLPSVFLLQFACADCTALCSSFPPSPVWPWTWIWPSGITNRCGFDSGLGQVFCAIAPQAEPGTLLSIAWPFPPPLVFGLGPPKGTRVHLLDVPLVSQRTTANMSSIPRVGSAMSVATGLAASAFLADLWVLLCDGLFHIGILWNAFFRGLAFWYLLLLLCALRAACQPCNLCCRSCFGAPAKALLSIGAIGTPCRSALHWEAPSPPLRGQSQASPNYSGLPWVPRLLLFTLGFANMPFCARAAPSVVWGECIAEIDRFAQGLPEPLPPQEFITPDPADPVALIPCGSSQVPVPEPQPPEVWPDFRAVPDYMEVFQCFFDVLCPMYQSEILTLGLRVPGMTVPEVLSEVSRALGTLRLTYSKVVVPVFPQLHPGHASVVMCGSWHENYGDAVVIFDFRALGGHVFAKHVCLRESFATVRNEAWAQGFRHWEAFLFGSTQPLQAGEIFRAVQGGVMQYRPPGCAPVWYGDFASRLQSRASWFSCPLGLVQQPTATLMLGSGVCRIFVPALAQGSSLTEAAAEFVGQDASRITCAMPSLGRLADLRLDGTPCKDVMAVHNALPPDPDTPPGYCIFLDSRQVGRIPTFVWLWRNEVDMGYLARAAGVHRIPVGYHLSLANARPSLRENHIWVSSGDTLVFGFRNEEDSDLSSGAGTDGDDNAPEDSETSTRPPDTEPDDGSPLQHAQQMPSDDPPDRSARSRSPRRCGLLPLGFCRSFEYFGSVGLVSLGHSECNPRRWCKWAVSSFPRVAFHDGKEHLTPAPRPGRAVAFPSFWSQLKGACLWPLRCLCETFRWHMWPDRFSDQNTFVPGSCPVTPMLSNGSCIATDLKASPPTLQQRLERPLGGWRDTPGAEHAPENEEELDTIDAFTGPHIDDDPESSDSEEEAPATAVFLVLSVDCIPEQVEIELAPHMSVQEALDAVNDCRPHHRYLLFPRICPASPQPTRHWGVLIASPAWAEAERIACCDSRSIDGRLFALIVPIAATRGQLCRLAGLPDDGSVNVFPYGAIQPLGADDLADYVVGGTIIFSHRPLLSRVGFRLDQLLAMQYAWDLDPDLPSGPIGYHYCTAFEGGHRRVTHDRLTDHNVCDAIARSEAMSVAQFSIQHATPRITDCAVLGYHCQDVIAVIPHEAWPDGARPTPVLLDCRAIHQGWALYLAEDCRVSHSSLIYDLDTFVPAGWQVQLDPIDIDDGYFTVAPGMVLVVSYVPLSSDEELLPDQPWDGFHGQDSRDDSSSDEEDAASDGAGEPPPGRTPAQTERSRSRSPQAHTERSAKTRPHCQHNVALFFLRIVLGICWLGGHGASLLVICSLWSFAGDPRGVGVLRPLVLVSLLGCGMLPAAGVQVQMQGLFRPHGHCFSDDMSLPTPATDRVYRDLPHGGGAPVEGCLWLHHSAHRPLPTPCRAFLRDAPLDIGETQTLLEESLSKPDSQALFLASTLLEVLFEHFGLAVSPVAPRALAPATSPVRISLQDSLPAPVVAPTVSLCEPEIYDLDALQCLLPGRSDVFLELFGRLPFSSLQPAPQGLEKPWRFSDWLACGCPGRSPGPGHTLVITSDGSYRAQDHAAGWGLSVSILQLGYDSLPGQFVGCLYGPMQPFLTYLGCPGAVDAYSAEVAGLLWSAVVALQLPVVCPVVLRSDNVAALHGVQGLCGMRSSPLCLAARSLHAALAIRLATLVSYAHVRGHTGDFANELSDALAALGALGHSRTSPFAFDVEHFLQNSAAAAQWLPHICLTSLRPNELPALRGQLMSWSVDEGACHHAPGHSMRPFLRAFPAAAATPPGASVEHIGFSLCLVSYNVLSLSDGARDAQQGLHGAVGRPTLLQQSLSEFGAHVIGLQECRTPQGRARIGSYTRFCSGCDAKSCFGVELWVSDTGPCAASSVVVFHTSPTILIAGAKIGELPVRVLVGHAPHRGHTAEFRKAWWDATSGLCHSFAHGCPWLFLLDANCRVGSIVSCAVGGHQADEEDDAGASFHSLILSLQISLPATFYVHMQGPGGTLLQKRNGALERSDFIGVPQDWLSGRCSARVEPGVTSGHACADHFAAMLEVHLTLCQSLPKQARAARIDARAIGDPQNAAAVSEIIRSAPRPAWEIDASEHAAEVVDYLYLGLVARFPLKRKPMRAHFFTETTVALHRAVAALRHAVRARSSALHFTYLRCAWLGDHLRSPLSLPFRATGCGNCARG